MTYYKLNRLWGFGFWWAFSPSRHDPMAVKAYMIAVQFGPWQKTWNFGKAPDNPEVLATGAVK